MKQNFKMNRKKMPVLILMALAVLLLAACGGADAEATAVPAESEVVEDPTAVPPTEAPPTEAPPTEEPLNMANPAAVYCLEQGYTYEIRSNDDGSQYGVCILDDGTECDGWAFFNGACPEVVEESSSADTVEHVPDANLINKTWAWESRDPNGNSSEAIEIPDPENYTLYFKEDGTFSAKLDCNNGAGEYATSGLEFEQHNIMMQLGPMTMAACDEDSYAPQMGQMFGPVQNYTYEENGQVLKFIWAAGGPIDYFRNVTNVELPDAAEGAAVGLVTAPDGVFLRTGPGTNYPYIGAAPFEEEGTIIGVSEDGLWWLADAPNLPEGQVWVTAEWVVVTGAENVPVVAAPPVEPTLTGTPWEWVSTTDPAQGTVAVNDSSRYVILFNDDGTAYIQADCNNVQATYTTSGSNITITTGPSTMAACPSDTLDSQFLAQLSSAVIYFISGGNLYLDMPADSGTMRFVPQGTPPPVEDAPAGEGDGKTFYLVSFGVPGAEQAPIAGTQITASFADDLVTGNAGCNNYSGTLTPVDDHFTVGPIVTTQMFCSAPAGVMEQEQAYLTALEATGGFLWEETRTDNGALVTEGKLFYFLSDGTAGALNFTTSPPQS